MAFFVLNLKARWCFWMCPLDQSSRSDNGVPAGLNVQGHPISYLVLHRAVSALFYSQAGEKQLGLLRHTNNTFIQLSGA